MTFCGFPLFYITEHWIACLDSGLFVCLKTSHRVLANNNGNFFSLFSCQVSTNKLIEAAILIEISLCMPTLKQREKQKQPQNTLFSNNQTSVSLSGRSWLGKLVFREKTHPTIWTSHSVLLQVWSPSLTNTNTGVWYKLSSEEQQWFIKKKSAGYFSLSAVFFFFFLLPVKYQQIVWNCLRSQRRHLRVLV